ncbi:hypothetical protein BDQ12DRAFT_744594 [Crucibulum laeve]|uniref:Uncharacterized protein n=1 Tax=Crucibulum laeve TaxID=68775 RepID=A0A5C3M333_9AGAR|nr:hypothetical protein BDQ12DRAFT_744594 [Crucibulum laeve]
MAPLSITEAHLLGLFVQSLCFGVYLVTAGFTIPPLLCTGNRFRRSREVNWVMLLGASALCIFITFDMVLSFYHSLLAFVSATGPDAATGSYTDISSWINVTKASKNSLTGFYIHFFFQIYRCWVVYSRSWLSISLSLLLWLGCLACGVRFIFLAGTLHVPALVYTEVTFPYNVAFWGISVAVNIVTTGLLVWRLWTVDQEMEQYRTNQSVQHESLLRHVMRIILESGMIYTVSALATFITVITKSTSYYPMTALAISAVGVAFNLIIMRSARRDSMRNAISSSNGTIALQFRSPQQRKFSVTQTNAKSRIVTAEDIFYESEASLREPVETPERSTAPEC